MINLFLSDLWVFLDCVNFTICSSHVILLALPREARFTHPVG